MRLSDDIHNFITEIVDVLQQFYDIMTANYDWHYDCQKIEKIVSLLMRYVN